MILPDWKIIQEMKKGNIVIEPFDADLSQSVQKIIGVDGHEGESEMIQPSTVDVHLGNEFVPFKKLPNQEYIDPFDEENEYGEEVIESDTYMLNPGEFVLGKTKERFKLPDDIRATVEGRSSWGRLAVTPHIEAGYIDPMYEGRVTLEITNMGPMPVEIRAGARFCQFEFARLESPSMHGYDGKYQGDEDISTSKLYQDGQ